MHSLKIYYNNPQVHILIPAESTLPYENSHKSQAKLPSQSNQPKEFNIDDQAEETERQETTSRCTLYRTRPNFIPDILQIIERINSQEFDPN